MFASRLHAALVFTCALAAAALTACDGGTPPPPPAQATGTTTTAPTATGGTPAAAAVKLPSYWYADDIAKNWRGKQWSKIDLFTFLKEPPTGLDTGTKYVVFFGRTCDHCEEMFNDDFATNPGLAADVLAVEVPVDKDTLRGEDAWPLPDTECRFGELRIGPDWIMTTPVTVKLKDGVVQCAQEGGHAECMGL